MTPLPHHKNSRNLLVAGTVAAPAHFPNAVRSDHFHWVLFICFIQTKPYCVSGTWCVSFSSFRFGGLLAYMYVVQCTWLAGTIRTNEPTLSGHLFLCGVLRSTLYHIFISATFKTHSNISHILIIARIKPRFPSPLPNSNER